MPWLWQWQPRQSWRERSGSLCVRRNCRREAQHSATSVSLFHSLLYSGRLFFILAAVLNSYLPAGAPLYHDLASLGRFGLTVTLFLVGTNISRSTLKTVGTRPLVQGLILWLVIASLSLMLIRVGAIAL